MNNTDETKLYCIGIPGNVIRAENFIEIIRYKYFGTHFTKEAK